MLSRGGAIALAMLAVAAMASSAVAQGPRPPSARDFVNQAAQSDHYEIDASRTALAQSRDPRIRAFAQAMIRDHQQMLEALTRAAAASHLPPPAAGLGGDQSKMLYALQGKTGREFDKAFATQQTLAHVQAAAVMRTYADMGADPNIRQAASKALPMIDHHLQMAQQLKTALGGD